jgi:RNA polymerase sigma-70 factor (ECF subfamily)
VGVLAEGTPSFGAEAWVVRTALNVGVSGWRRRARELPLADHDVAALPARPLTGLDAAMLRSLRRLPARQREVIVWRVFLDLDTDTTARQLKIAPGTVRAHLSRAIATLRNELDLENTKEAHPCPKPIS